MEQFYANKTAEGNLAFYTDVVHTPEQIPVTAIPITQKQWLDAINNQGKYTIINSKFVLTPPISNAILLARAREDKIAELNLACDNDVAKGFTSAINGHSYGLKLHDQINFLGSKAKLDGDLTMTTIRFKAEDLGYQIDHTREDFLKIMGEGMSKIEGLIARCNDLKEIVINAKTEDEIKAVAW